MSGRGAFAELLSLKGLRGWAGRLPERLKPFLPRLGEKRFWVVQGIVVVVAAIHDILEVGGFLPRLGALYFLPISVFFLPVIYAALNFGFAGSIATVAWIVIVTVPNWILWHSGLERAGVIFQMAIFVAVAGFVGRRVDREASARQKAEAAGAALKAYAAHVVKVQEDERKNIARELHDESLQDLALLCRQLDSVGAQSSLPVSAVSELNAARTLSEGVIKKLREFARELRPPHLDDLSLSDSINKLLLDFSDRSGIESFFETQGKEEELTANTKVGLYRITQEALWNIERHSQATEVRAKLNYGASDITFSVKDNGVGFKPPDNLQALADSNHYGLVGMHERAELLGGRLEVQTSPGWGTTLTVKVPLSSG